MQKINLSPETCIIFIGMPSAGKTTLAKLLAQKMDYAYLDTDHAIEALYGVNLQKITDVLSKDAFLDLEAEVISKLHLSHTIISTGGSAIYREYAMQYLKSLGPCVFLSAPLDLLLERIALNPDRGIAIAPGQTIEDLYNERMELYNKYADITIKVDYDTSPEFLVNEILSYFKG